MNFKEFIDYDSREVIVKKGEVLYHGTGESFDTRKIRPGGYDQVFWTADDPMIARTYIPAKGSYLMTSADSLLRDKEHENIRKSLGITDEMKRYAWKKQEKGYQRLKYWEEKKKEFATKMKEMEKARFYDMPDSFFSQWGDAEDKYKEAMQNWKTYDRYLKAFIIHKMKAFGYEPTSKGGDYFTKITTDEQGFLLPLSHRLVGRVLKLICNRDFKFYNYAYGQEGDLTDVDYHKTDMFRKIEKAGYDGVIINDFAQSSYHGNYGHRSLGFFKSAVKDLTVKQIRNQTHPRDEEWE